jgi:hypothetical protein
VGPTAGLDGCGKSRSHRDSIPVPPSQYRVVIPTTLSRPTDCMHKAQNSTMSCGRAIKLQGTQKQCDILKCWCTRCMMCWYMRQHCCATNTPRPLFGHHERSLAWSCEDSRCSMPSGSQTRSTAYPRKCWTIQHTTKNCHPVTSLCSAHKKALKSGRLGSGRFS